MRFVIAVRLELKPAAVPNEVQGGHEAPSSNSAREATGPRQGRYAVPRSSDCSLTSVARFKLGDVRGAAWSGGVAFEGHAGRGGGGAGSGAAGIRASCGV